MLHPGDGTFGHAFSVSAPWTLSPSPSPASWQIYPPCSSGPPALKGVLSELLHADNPQSVVEGQEVSRVGSVEVHGSEPEKTCQNVPSPGGSVIQVSFQKDAGVT